MKNKAGLVRRLGIRAALTARDIWLIGGMTIAIVIAVELLFRAQQAIKSEIADRLTDKGASTPPNPFDTTTWGKEYVEDHARADHVLWEPYVYIRNPTFRGPVISIDALGHRVTSADSADSRAPLRIFFFGGSTMLGWFQRDAHTIPAETTRRLQAQLGLTERVEPTNFGVPGRVFTQEVLELTLQLKSGARPDIVVFYDGINDVLATVQEGGAGIPQNESTRRADFERGRLLRDEARSGNSKFARWATRVLLEGLNGLKFVRALRTRLHPASEPVFISTDSATRSIVRTYADNARLVEVLAAAYRFQPVYIWQPALFSSRKPLSAREHWLLSSVSGSRSVRKLRDVHAAVPGALEQTMSPLVGRRFIDLTPLFSDDSADVYVDVNGHTYERANTRIVDAIMPLLTAAAVAQHTLKSGAPTGSVGK